MYICIERERERDSVRFTAAAGRESGTLRSASPYGRLIYSYIYIYIMYMYHLYLYLSPSLSLYIYIYIYVFIYLFKLLRSPVRQTMGVNMRQTTGVYIHACIQSYMHASVHPCIRAHMHTCTHADIHSHAVSIHRWPIAVPYHTRALPCLKRSLGSRRLFL